MGPVPAPSHSKYSLASVDLDTHSIKRGNPDIEHERQVAIFDLLSHNHFRPLHHQGGPYRLILSIVDKRLVLDVRLEKSNENIITHVLSLSPLRRIVKDYFLICDSYFEAIKMSSPRQIEAIDMGRRGLHDEGARILIERLQDKITLDFDTARRLFTLICVLHWEGVKQ
jgi:uncharacterized protein (UPF0262 family)